ncbi:MAG: hypothetical protein K8H84_15165 [Sulfuricella denitrificans]|nr:hypothetical protein [Sulfuricella denitrificans]
MMKLLASALLLVSIPAASAGQVLCHYTYGGETRILAVQAVKSPYAVRGVKVGSYFQFRPVFQSEPADQAAIKIYTYVERDEGPTLIHQSSFPYPLLQNSAASPYGFSGLHRVYEPARDGELQYWCEMDAGTEARQ